MQEVLLQPSRPQIMPFSDFLTVLFQAIEGQGLRPCVLRNYEGFPAVNVGGDIDFLIHQDELPRVMCAVRSIQGIRIVGYTQRSYVASVFLEGTSSTEGSRSQQLDFLWSLSWKEMPYLAPDDVLRLAIPHSAGNLKFFVPLPVHEAIISLLMGLIVGKWVKEKYFPKVQRTFTSERSQAIATLRPPFGLKAATRLVDSVISGDCQKVIGCISSIRVSLTLHSLLRRPLRSVQGVVLYYVREFATRFSPKNLGTVCVICPDEYNSTTIIDKLIPLLKYSAKIVQRGHFRPLLSCVHNAEEIPSGNDSYRQTQNGSFVSMVKIILWMIEEWLRQFIGKKNDTLRVCDSCYHDLLIDPQRYRYGGPMWFARFIGKLFPSPDLWVLLDTPADTMQSRNQEFPSAEALGQLEAYRAFVKTRKRYVILDASQPIDCITENAYAAIIDTLAQRADRKLKNRF